MAEEDKKEENSPAEHSKKEHSAGERHEEHHEHHEEKKKSFNIAKVMKANPWMLATVVLAVLSIVLLIFFVSGGSNVSANTAGNKLTAFLNTMVGGGVEYVNSTDLGGVYEVNVAYNGQDLPVYITKDGKYFVQAITPITSEEDTSSETQPTPTDVPKTDKPVVELFIMSHCPYGTQAEKGIIPAVELLGDKIDFKIRFVYYSMHGEIEVLEQLNQHCIQTEQEDKLLDYLKCFLGKTGTVADGESCLDSVGIDKAKLQTCTTAADIEFDIFANLNNQSKWLSGSFPMFNIDLDANNEYAVGGSPTLIINGVQSNAGRSPQSYLDGICVAFSSSPAECSQTLSLSSSSAGFGYNEGIDSVAQC